MFIKELAVAGSFSDLKSVAWTKWNIVFLLCYDLWMPLHSIRASTSQE